MGRDGRCRRACSRLQVCLFVDGQRKHRRATAAEAAGRRRSAVMGRRHQETNQHMARDTCARQPSTSANARQHAVHSRRSSAVTESRRRRVLFRPTEAFQRPPRLFRHVSRADDKEGDERRLDVGRCLGTNNPATSVARKPSKTKTRDEPIRRRRLSLSLSLSTATAICCGSPGQWQRRTRHRDETASWTKALLLRLLR